MGEIQDYTRRLIQQIKDELPNCIVYDMYAYE